MRLRALLFVLLFATVMGYPVGGQADTLVLDDPGAAYRLLDAGRFMPDPDRRWVPDDIAGLHRAVRDEGIAHPDPAVVRETSRYWVVTRVQNESSLERWMVSVLVPSLDRVSLVVETDRGERTVMPGGRLEAADRLFPAVGYAHGVELAQGQARTLYLLVDNSLEPGVEFSELLIRSQTSWAHRAFELTGFVMLCLGAILALSLFFLIIWLRLQETTYLWFGLFSAATAVLWATAYDMIALFMGHSWDNSLVNFAANALSLSFCAMFARRFLRTQWLSKKLDVVFVVFALASASLVAAMFVLPAPVTYVANAAAALALWLLLVGASIFALVRGERDARLFLAAWGVFLVSAFLTIIEALGASLPAMSVRLWTVGTTAAGMLMMALAVGTQLRRLQRARRSAEYQARTDALTGLGNRTAFDADLRDFAEMFNEERYAEVKLAYMDLDGLKNINDARGHETGDNLLRTFARLLEREFRDDDRAYRLGGDEFVLILPARSAPEKGDHEWLRKRLSGVIAKLRNSGFAEAGVSIGIAGLTETGGNPKEALARADARMYADKRRARP